MSWAGRLCAVAAAGAGLAAAGYAGLMSGAIPVNAGVGRRTRHLGPRAVDINAPREVVFDVVSRSYLSDNPHPESTVRVLERGSDMVLATQDAPVKGRLVGRTVEAVRFTRPERVDFRLVRGPVPHLVESFVLTQRENITRLSYEGELGTDLGPLGDQWGRKVARQWERSVGRVLKSVKSEAERHANVR